MPACVQYPTTGCLVEFFDANSAQAAFVLEDVAGKLRLLLPNRREQKLAASRILPWIAAPLPGFSSLGRDDRVRLLEAAKKKREELAGRIPVRDIWEMAQGEVKAATAQWFAELMETDPDADTVAAYGHALLHCRTHFRFVPPNFEVYDAEQVARKEEEDRKQQERDNIVATGNPFIHLLWNVSQGKAELPPESDPVWPTASVQAKLEEILRLHMENPDMGEDPLWTRLIKGLNDDHLLPVMLLTAWGRLPVHYNFWYDRAGYARGDEWWHKHRETVDELLRAGRETSLPDLDQTFVSIDGDSTRDIDDAFSLAACDDGGMLLTLVLACPALRWPFGTSFDSKILHRATSIYLPEGNSHMLPECLGTDAYSLVEGEKRPALVVAQKIDSEGRLDGECTVSFNRVQLAANLRYKACQEVLDGTAAEDNAALPYADMLKLAQRFAELRIKARVADGAVSLQRMEPKLEVTETEEEMPDSATQQNAGQGRFVQKYLVSMTPGTLPSMSQKMVAEMMILGSAAAANWAKARAVPLLHRTQDVALPREYAGVWDDPVKMTEIMRAMIPSSLEVEPHQHAALGLVRYAPVTSPLRRYADLVNEAQLLSYTQTGSPLFDAAALDQMLFTLRMALNGAGQVQRNRQRYWKLLYFRQCTDEAVWSGVVTEVTDINVTVALPEYDIFVRGRRRLFDEKTCAGMPVRIRIGRVNPLCNIISIVEVKPADSLPADDLGGKDPS